MGVWDLEGFISMWKNGAVSLLLMLAGYLLCDYQHEVRHEKEKRLVEEFKLEQQKVITTMNSRLSKLKANETVIEKKTHEIIEKSIPIISNDCNVSDEWVQFINTEIRNRGAITD